MKQLWAGLLGIVLLLGSSNTLATAQEDYDTLLRQRNALYQQLLHEGIMPCIDIETSEKSTTAIVADDETASEEFVYGSNGKEIRINSFIGDSTNIVIPQSIDGIPVTMIGDKAFAEAKILSTSSYLKVSFL